MSLLVVGLSHESADLALLERIGLSEQASEVISGRLLASTDVSEFLILATCNRLEVVAEAERFHGAVSDIATVLAEVSDEDVATMRGSLYVHYDDRAVHHLFSLACGLRSMALGEPQILGQLRQALVRAQHAGTVAGHLNRLLQHALRVGKRAHAETELDTVAKSLVQLGLNELSVAIPDLSRSRALVLGAGAMSAVATATLARAGVADLRVIARDPAKASALAARYGGSSVPWPSLGEQLATVDLLVTCTGATQPVVGLDAVAHAREGHREGALAILDLALPSDVEAGVGDLPGVYRCGLTDVHARRRAHEDTDDPVLRQVRDLVTAEVAVYLSGRRAHEVAPTVAALRAQAGAVVEEELARLDQRLPGLGDAERAEVRRALGRVVDKLLHTPTVRVKEKHAQDQPEDYARVLRELFDLDPHETVAVSIPPLRGPDGVR
jgi:glutamyl-tRNA reductase